MSASPNDWRRMGQDRDLPSGTRFEPRQYAAKSVEFIEMIGGLFHLWATAGSNSATAQTSNAPLPEV